MTLSRRSQFGLAVLVVAAACTGSKSHGPRSLAASVGSEALVRLGETAPLPLVVERTGFSSDVTVTLLSGPSGLTASGTILAATTAGNVTLTAAPGTPISYRVPAVLRVSSANDPAVTTTAAFTFTAAMGAGAHDASFSGDGAFAGIFGYDSAVAIDVVILADGSLVVAGAGSLATFPEAGVVHVLEDGTWDTAFGTAGVAHVGFLSVDDEPTGMGRDAAGRYILCGSSGTSNASLCRRLLANGTNDATYVAGTVAAFRAYGQTVRPDGGTVLVGFVSTNGIIAPGVATVSPDGAPVTRSVISFPAMWNAVAVAGDGTLFTAGESNNGLPAVPAQPYLAHLGPAGAPIASFGTGGFVTLALGTNSTAHAITLDEQSRLLVAGTRAGAPSTGFVARLSPTGVLDSTFGTGGIATSSRVPCFDVALQADGKIICGGNGGLIRFTAAGVEDVTFADQGYSAFLFPSDASPSGCKGLAVQDYRIVGVGIAISPPVPPGFAPSFIEVGFGVIRFWE